MANNTRVTLGLTASDSTTIAVRIPNEQAEAIRRWTRSMGSTPSELARRALTAEMKRVGITEDLTEAV